MTDPRDPSAAAADLPRPPAAAGDNHSGTRTPAPSPGDPSIIVVGDLVTDVLVVTPDALAVGSDTTGTVRYTGGGQAANTAAWLTRAAPAVTLVAAVGDDDTGRTRIAELTRLGVRCAVTVHQGTATGSVVVLTSAGERTMVADRGANLLLTPADVTAAITGALRPATMPAPGTTQPDASQPDASQPDATQPDATPSDTNPSHATQPDAAPSDTNPSDANPTDTTPEVTPPEAAGRGAHGACRTGGHVHLSAYPLLDARTRPAGLAALAAARAGGATTSVDAASAAPLATLGAAAFLDLVRDVDLLLANTDEADVLAGPGPSERQAATLCAVARNVVVKRGAAGAVWCTRDGVTASVAAERVHPRDPTGAGDAFAAGLLAAWCAGASPAAALAAGAALGARAVGQVGARPES